MSLDVLRLTEALTSPFPAVELLPAEQRRLLKWKLSTVTPNVVKYTVDRSHFKFTKSESTLSHTVES